MSESARATTLEEARYRVNYPNSAPRQIKVIALDRISDQVIRRLAQKPWHCTTFVTTPDPKPTGPVPQWLDDLKGQALDLLEQVRAADLVVTVSTAGESSSHSSMIAEACRLHNVMMTSLVIDDETGSQPALLKTMVPLRAHALMLVVANGEEYVEAMLAALRAT
jgi:hypothetical protein